MEKELSRKDFFKTAAKYAAGTAAGAAMVDFVTTQKASAKTSVQPWPWPYQKLDPEYVRKLAHDSFWSGKACSYGAFNGIIAALQEVVGEPFTLIPTEIMIYGHGGGVGWGTLCGALNGSSAAISLVCEKEISDKLVSELIGWYTQIELPTPVSNQYGVDQAYTVNKYTQELPQNASGSPLCHASVTQWCEHAHLGVSSLERKERCARLDGDVAAYAVELLNQNLEGQFNPQYSAPESIAKCMTCHGSAVKDNVLSKMECVTCHGDPHATSAVMPTIAEAPAHFNVYQNYPNPFNPSTKIQFSIPVRANVTLSIYDVYGRNVRTLISNREFAPKTLQTVEWDGRDEYGQKVASGTYFYKLQAGKSITTRKMTLAR